MRYKRAILLLLLWLFPLTGAGCAGKPPDTQPSPTARAEPTAGQGTGQSPFVLIPFESMVRQVSFQSEDGTRLAGQLDLPPGVDDPPLVFILHHSGPVDRDSYQYLAAFLVPNGYAVFRFDKRGNGQSEGVYGCCEAQDALAAYRAATALTGFDRERIYVVAQSVGTQILADRYDQFTDIAPVHGVVLLSSLLKGKEVLPIESPIHILVSDSEPELRAITEEAVEAHRKEFGGDASFRIVPYTEHTLFDISQGPIDWDDANWPLRFSKIAADDLLTWLLAHD